MIWFYIGAYTLFLTIVWGFFIVTKIHAFKFKNFSNNISKVTYILFIVLVILSVLGYITIFIGDYSSKTYIRTNNNNPLKSIEY